MSTGRADPPSGGALIRPFLNRFSTSSSTAPVPAGDVPGVRPFLVTSGRTPKAGSYPVETQVVTTPQGETGLEALTFESHDIARLCREPLAVAEIGARLHLHLGVVRVLIDDLQQQGMVTIVQPEVDPADDVETILRVIHGLRQRD